METASGDGDRAATLAPEGFSLERAMVPDPAVEVRDLRKRYPKSPVDALAGITFGVARGEVFGLLGPNGAGKTTTVGILTTRVLPTAGVARISGVDVVARPTEARTRLAVVPQRNNLDRSLTIRQNLLFHAAYHGVARAERRRRADALLEQFGLAERADDRIDWLSGGQAQRIMIARSLMHEPDVLFLDEPTTGLDPAARLFVWDRVRDLQTRGVTVLLTTHDMDEAASLTERVGIVDHGRLLALDAPANLTRSLPGRTTLDVSLATEGAAVPEVLAALDATDGVERVERVEEAPGSAVATLRVRLYVSRDAALMIPPVASRVSTLGASLTDVRIGEPSLEDVFIHLTGRALR